MQVFHFKPGTGSRHIEATALCSASFLPPIFYLKENYGVLLLYILEEGRVTKDTCKLLERLLTVKPPFLKRSTVMLSKGNNLFVCVTFKHLTHFYMQRSPQLFFLWSMIYSLFLFIFLFFLQCMLAEVFVFWHCVTDLSSGIQLTHAGLKDRLCH